MAVQLTGVGVALQSGVSLTPTTPQMPWSGASLVGGVSISGSAVLPASGLLGVWYMDQYQSSPNNNVPNAVSTQPISANLVPAPRRMFGDAGTIYWLQNGNTVTDLAAVAPDGSNDATTVVLGLGGNLQSKTTLSVAAGTYTAAIWAKRNTGSDQVFAFGAFGHFSTAQTATSAWQRFSFQFVLGSTTSLTLSPAFDINNVSPNIQIIDFNLFAGSVDLGAAIPSGHLYLGRTNSDTASLPTASSTGILDFSAPGTAAFGIAQFASGIDWSKFTMIALLSKVAAGNTRQAFISSATTFASLTGYAEQVGPLALAYGGSNPAGGNVTYGGYLQDSGALLLTGQNYHMMAHRYDQNSMSTWFDDMRVFQQNVGAIAKPTVADIQIGTNLAASGILGYKVSSVALYNRDLSDAEMRTAFAALTSRAVRSSITVTPATRVVAAEGDSLTGEITVQTAPQTWPYLFGVNASPFAYVFVRAFSGTTLANLNTRAASVDAILPTSRSGRKFILAVWDGANDQAYPGGATQFAADLATYLDARRAAGWLVVVSTLTPQTTAGFNTFRNTVNAIIKGWSVGQHYDALADVGSDTTIGPDAAASNATFYTSGIHLTAAGQAIAEPIFRAAVNGL